MKPTIPMILLLGFPHMSGHAAESYSASIERLQSKQSVIDQSLRSLRSKYGFQESAPVVAQSSEDANHPKLLVVHNSVQSAQLPTGKLLFGRTISRLVVSSEGAPALIELDERQGAVSGLRMLGIARPSSTQGRLMIDIQKLLLPSRAIELQATALDTDGAQGLVAEVFSSKAWSIAGAMAGSFISGLASAQQTQSIGALGFTQTQPTGRNAILQGVAQTAADQSKRLVEEATAEKPVLVVERSTEVSVLIQGEVRF